MSDNIVRQTLPEQIYKILRSDILNQEIKCGSKLTLQSLKTRFGVSHTPIREALTRLVEDDLVTYYSNVGITVVSLTGADIKEIFQLSYDLDCLAIRYAFKSGNGQALVAELQDNVKKCHEQLNSNRIRQWGDTSDRFHLAFYDHADNARLHRAALKLRAQITLIYNLYKIESENCRNIQSYHDGVYENLRDGNVEKALEILSHHLTEDMNLALEKESQLT